MPPPPPPPPPPLPPLQRKKGRKNELHFLLTHPPSSRRACWRPRPNHKRAVGMNGLRPRGQASISIHPSGRTSPRPRRRLGRRGVDFVLPWGKFVGCFALSVRPRPQMRSGVGEGGNFLALRDNSTSAPRAHSLAAMPNEAELPIHTPETEGEGRRRACFERERSSEVR